MKLTSYQIREALREGRHMDAAVILAQHYGYVMEPPEKAISVTRVPHTGYAMRMWLGSGSRGFEWDEGDLYSTIGIGRVGPLTAMVIWEPHEDR